jgi:hypothetical protein
MLEIQLIIKREWVWNQLTGLTTPHAYACRKPGHEIPENYQAKATC